MWKIALLGIAAVIASAGLGRAEDVGPWCLHEDIGGGVVTDRCHFESYAECRSIIGGLGGSFCTQNPNYVAPPPAAPQPVAAPPPARRAEPKRPEAKKPEAKKPKQPN